MPSHTRRQVLAMTGLAGVGLAGCLSRPSPAGDLDAVDGDWPMSGLEPGHTRHVHEGPPGRERVWTTELDDARAAGTPSVADGRLYVPVDAVSDRARHRYQLHALTGRTGDRRWQVPLRSNPNSSPAVHGDYVVVSTRRELEQGRVVGFRTRYGDEEWLYDVDARLTAPPTIDGRTVYVPDWDGRVHALSVADGSVRWSRRIGDDESGRTFAEPAAVHDGTLYLGSQSGTTGLVAVDAETGEESWSRSTDTVTAAPVVVDGLVVVRTYGPVVACDTDGTDRWTFNVPEDDWRSIALDDHHVYVPGRETLYAIDRTGEEAWTYRSSEGPVGPPTVIGDSVVFLEDGRLTALARADGSTRWSTETSGSGEVIAVPNAVFLTGSDGSVTALGDG